MDALWFYNIDRENSVIVIKEELPPRAHIYRMIRQLPNVLLVHLYFRYGYYALWLIRDEMISFHQQVFTDSKHMK